ncbi:unnamed protein product [Brassica rapa]|uniref:Uncharacterized protein n=1 Tax=Brassica campestris TaxID=3711 RepID=A0A8D9HJU2_BRACM|nr:unnamed protein product [Brassica rapa]
MRIIAYIHCHHGNVLVFHLDLKVFNFHTQNRKKRSVIKTTLHNSEAPRRSFSSSSQACSKIYFKFW